MKTKKTLFGFSLLELLIAVAVIAILIAIAVPTYRTYMLKSNRADAINSLLAIQLAEERYRLSNAAYGDLTQVWNGVTTTEGGYYTLSVSGLSATSYTITATAVGDQANDSQDGTSCATLSLSYASNAVTKTPTECWQ